MIPLHTGAICWGFLTIRSIPCVTQSHTLIQRLRRPRHPLSSTNDHLKNQNHLALQSHPVLQSHRHNVKMHRLLAEEHPNNSVQAGRKNTKAFADNTSKITLSSTFLHVRKGEAFSLHATAVTSQNYHLNWEFSSSGFLKKSSVKSRKNSSDITLTANRTGMVIVTCRTKENRTISCSCTIKITE